MARTGPLWEPVLLLFAQEFDEADVLYYLAHFIICQIVRGVHEPPLQSGKIRLREIHLPPEIGFRHAIAGGNSGDVRKDIPLEQTAGRWGLDSPLSGVFRFQQSSGRTGISWPGDMVDGRKDHQAVETQLE